jgi:hypothetical protein
VLNFDFWKKDWKKLKKSDCEHNGLNSKKIILILLLKKFIFNWESI